MIWSFEPGEPQVFIEEKPFEKKVKPKKNSWKAPEHSRMTSDMRRDFPRDDLGFPLEGSKKDVLIVDPRPTIMRPERKFIRHIHQRVTKW